MDISNKTLVVLLVGAIAISLFGTIISINKLNQVITAQPTGYVASTTGTATVNVSSIESLTFTAAAIDFGIGSVNGSGTWNNCTMYANASGADFKGSGCVNFSATLQPPLTIENDGNKNLSVQLAANATAAQFIGGNSVTPLFQYAVYNNETSSCAYNATPGVWTDVNTTGAGTLICPDFQKDSIKDTLNIGVKILIPLDALGGARTAKFTATGTAI